MAGYLTDYANNKILDLLFGSVPYLPSTTLYLGLSISSAAKSGAVVEPTGGNYSRVGLSNDLSHFPIAAAGTKTNATSVIFPVPNQSWGTIASVFVSDAATGGNILAMADLPVSKTISATSGAPSIAIGALFISHT